MRRAMKLIALAAAVMLLLTGCMDFSALQEEMPDPNATEQPTMPPLEDPVYTDREALYEWYNAVNIGDTLEALTEKFGEPRVDETENGENYVWEKDDGSGFAAVFYEDGRLRAKVLCYKDIRQLKELSGATNLNNVSALSKDHEFSTVCLALGGRPMEIAAISQDSSVNPEVKRVFAWLDSEGSCVQVLFSGKEKLESVSYFFADE